MSAIAKLLASNPNIKLPTPPAIALHILDEVRKEEPSFARLTEIIATDPALASRVLRIANSPMMAPLIPIDSLDKALTRMGITQVTNIALSFVLVGGLRDDEGGVFDFNYFWKRSVTTAVSANIIARKVITHSDHIFITALLHDIGIVVACLCLPEYRALFDAPKDDNHSVNNVERGMFGFTHGELGSELLEQWGLPPQITKSILFHNQPSEAPNDLVDSVRIIKIASHMSAIFHGRPTTTRLPEIKTTLRRHYALDNTDIEQLINDSSIQCSEVLALFEISGGLAKSSAEILQEANEELFNINMEASKLVDQYQQEKEQAEQTRARLAMANKELSRLAFQDSLTGIYNLRYFHDSLERELQRAQRYNHVFSLIMFDIDDFKQINDSYGHQAGDKMLQFVAAKALETTRTSDIVARYGGEEFAIILSETSIDTAADIAERLRKNIETMRMEWEGSQLSVTISLGISYFCTTTAQLTTQQLIAVADAGLYRSKRSGKNRVSLPQ